jgi:hypothetical protein
MDSKDIENMLLGAQCLSQKESHFHLLDIPYPLHLHCFTAYAITETCIVHGY